MIIEAGSAGAGASAAISAQGETKKPGKKPHSHSKPFSKNWR